MVIGRANRRDQRRAAVASVFGASQVEAALDLLELLELAWHDSYRESSPPEEIVDDVLQLSDGNLEQLIFAARLAVTDWRDLKMTAESHRQGS